MLAGWDVEGLGAEVLGGSAKPGLFVDDVEETMGWMTMLEVDVGDGVLLGVVVVREKVSGLPEGTTINTPLLVVKWSGVTVYSGPLDDELNRCTLVEDADAVLLAGLQGWNQGAAEVVLGLLVGEDELVVAGLA